MHGQIQFSDDLNSLSQHVAESFIAMMAIKTGHLNIALAGGSTPETLYRLLASDTYRHRIDWSRLSFYFGDERYVAHEHDESNYKMAKQALLDHLPIDTAQVFPVPTHLKVQLAAEQYEHLIQENLPQQNYLPCFDLVLLGMGDDGHTASLFPDTPILHDQRLVAAVYVEKFKSWRISMTYALINNARQVWIMVSGSAKAKVFDDLQSGQGEHYPIARINPRGELIWFVEQSVLTARST